ncbi:hypothetical protein [Candidatus Hodarchaeum mangrovi]
MSVEQPPNRSQYSKKIIRFLKDLPAYIIEYKSAIIFIVAWLIIAEIAGYSFVNLFIMIIKLLAYPLYLILFNTEFRAMKIPEIFILLIPLVFFVLIGFLTIIATED